MEKKTKWRKQLREEQKLIKKKTKIWCRVSINPKIHSLKKKVTKDIDQGKKEKSRKK